VAESLGDKIDLILDGGACAIGVESTILSLTSPSLTVLRAGGVPVEELASVVGKLQILLGTEERPVAPGQMKRHYSTRTRLEILDENAEILKPTEKIGLLCLNEPAQPDRYAAIEVLSVSGNLREAASNFFGALRRLDKLSLDRIIARPIPELGLGLALMDRLRRAAASD
jgi:L-threonylcarbamoyladenylate synthase